ncbi:cytochrome oxidase assembly protein-domain-containing protein [Ochromonadaceae sp. CCMP2298]|nr:cytochrome oxidase assembly protein-domain-containing protein [Ochromonadaceae sp. CCMP2298]
MLGIRLAQSCRLVQRVRRTSVPSSLFSSRSRPGARTLSTATFQAEAQALTPSRVNARPVAYWIFGMSGLVAAMVSIGGITRLTRSGLSMTDWKLQGNLPPTSQEAWQVEFERYKLFPEWQQRQSMTLDEFKFIYFWEYGHRQMGRVVGVAFALPFAYFTARGMIPRFMYPRLGLLFSLGGAQGLIGWWMVRSGLDPKLLLDPEKRQTRVSPYRLATHLSMAFTTYVLLLWTGLDLLKHADEARDKVLSAVKTQASSVGQSLRDKGRVRQFSAEVLKYARKVRSLSVASGVLAATTVVSGAYVAGNDAGNAYNTFPLMGGEIAPWGEMLTLQPVWRNFFENTATVQFDHRYLAMSTLGLITATYATALGSRHWGSLPAASRTAAHLVAGMGATQVSLGIATLLLYVPIPLAAAHQLGSLVLLSFITKLAHSLNFARVSATASATASTAISGSAPVLASAMLVSSASAPAIAVALRSPGSGPARHYSTALAHRQRQAMESMGGVMGQGMGRVGPNQMSKWTKP